MNKDDIIHELGLDNVPNPVNHELGLEGQDGPEVPRGILERRWRNKKTQFVLERGTFGPDIQTRTRILDLAISFDRVDVVDHLCKNCRIGFREREISDIIRRDRIEIAGRLPTYPKSLCDSDKQKLAMCMIANGSPEMLHIIAPIIGNAIPMMPTNRPRLQHYISYRGRMQPDFMHLLFARADTFREMVLMYKYFKTVPELLENIGHSIVVSGRIDLLKIVEEICPIGKYIQPKTIEQCGKSMTIEDFEYVCDHASGNFMGLVNHATRNNWDYTKIKSLTDRVDMNRTQRGILSFEQLQDLMTPGEDS